MKTALELDGKYPKGKAIRQLRTIEQIKETHASISFYMKPNQKSGLKHIDVPKDFNNWNNIPKSKNIQWNIVTGQEKIEDILIDRNRQHLGQKTSKVLQLIGHDRYSVGADSILDMSLSAPPT